MHSNRLLQPTFPQSIIFNVRFFFFASRLQKGSSAHHSQKTRFVLPTERLLTKSNRTHNHHHHRLFPSFFSAATSSREPGFVACCAECCRWSLFCARRVNSGPSTFFSLSVLSDSAILPRSTMHYVIHRASFACFTEAGRNMEMRGGQKKKIRWELIPWSSGGAKFSISPSVSR